MKKTGPFIVLFILLYFLKCYTMNTVENMELKKYCNFFIPDQSTYEFLAISLIDGIDCIKNIKGQKEELFLVYQYSKYDDKNLFVDIGYNSQEYFNITSVTFNSGQLINYIIQIVVYQE